MMDLKAERKQLRTILRQYFDICLEGETPKISVMITSDLICRSEYEAKI
jgi:hypothetical protein